MLNCREISERTSDFIDAALPWRVRLKVRLHLMMCRLCREYVRQMTLVTRTLRRLPESEPPGEVSPDQLELFRAERQ